MKYLIDGYNVIFECGLTGKQVTADSLARARLKLLRAITSGVPTQRQHEFVVVFDARKEMLSGQREQQLFGLVPVLYSIHFDNADEMIESLIAQSSAPKILTVVSSDHRIQKAASRRKARSIDSGDWYDQLVAGNFLATTQNEAAADQDAARNETDALLSPEDLERFKADLHDELPPDENPWFAL